MTYPPVPIPVDESLAPCPKQHWLFGLCCGPEDHEGNHAVWSCGMWVSWNDEQCSESSTVIVCENVR
jgi:hypothetical protein